MDLINVFKPIVDFFVEYCSVVVTIGGFSFTVGALLIWCAIVILLGGFLRRLSV